MLGGYGALVLQGLQQAQEATQGLQERCFPKWMELPKGDGPGQANRFEAALFVNSLVSGI